MNRDPFGLGVLLYGSTVEWSATDPGMFALVSAGAMTLAHEDCAISTFCKNPLHPGPCKGWKKKLGVEAPGALKAIEAAHKEKVAARRVKVAEAKSAAAARAHAQGIVSPLHAKKATIKHANILLGNDEAKAGGKASKVILNKAEIKRYSKIKAAHINSIREKHNLPEDPGLEDRLAEAFAADNKNGDDTNYRASIFTAGHTLGTQLAEQHCKDGDHDCDGKAFEALRDKLADVAQGALLTGDDEPLDKALADYDAGNLDLTVAAAPAKPKAKIPAAAKGQVLAEANAKADVEAAAAKKKTAAIEPDAENPKPFNVAKAEQLFEPNLSWGASNSQKLALLDDMTPEEYGQLDPKTKKAVDTFLAEAAAAKGPATGALADKIQTKLGLKDDAGEPDLLQQLMDAVPMATGEPPQVVSAKQALAAEDVPQWQLKQAADKLAPEDWSHFTPDEQKKLKAAQAAPPPKPFDPYATPLGEIMMPDGAHANLHEMFGPNGDPDHQAVVDAVSVMSQDDYDSLTPTEKSMLVLHVSDAADYGAPGGDNAKAKLDAFMLHAAGTPTTPAAAPNVLSPEAQMAKNVAHGAVSQVAKKKLVTYEKVSGTEFEALDSDTQKLILADLLAMKAKFLDPKKKQQAQDQHDYLSKHMGGGTGAGGGGPAATATVGDADLAKAMQELPALASLTKPPHQADHTDAEIKDAFQGFVDASGHEKAADAISGVWADNALANLNYIHSDAYDPDVLAMAKPALAADIKKKLLGQPGPTPHLDAFKTAKTLGGVDDGDNFVADAVKASNPGLPSAADHHAKAVKLSLLWQDAAPGWGAKKTTADLEHDIGTAGGLGYGTPQWKAFAEKEGGSIAAGVMSGGFKALDLGTTDDKVELLGNPNASDVLEALSAEMTQAIHDGGLVPKGGYVEEFHNAIGDAKAAGDTLAAKNGWAVDSPVVKEYKKTVIAAKMDEMAAKIKGTAPATTSSPTGGAGAGGTGGSGSGKITLGGGTDSGFTDAQNQVITGTLKSQGINLSSSAQEVWDVAVAAAAAHQSKDGLPSSLTVLDVLNATDAGHAKNLGVTNTNLLRKKVVDWLGTPAGKKYAEDNSTPKPTIAAKLSGDLSIKLPPGQKVQTLSGPGPYDPKNNGPWVQKDVTAAFADQEKAWADQPDVAWNTTPHSYHKPGWKTKWTNEQQDGLYSYTLGSGTINDYLRGQKSDGTPVLTASHATKQTILNIQSAMMPLQEDHLFKRGTGWEQFPPGFRDPESVKQLIGKNITEKAFLSTSVPGGGSSGFGGPVRMEIEAPKGTYGAFVEGLSAFKGGVEQEMLLAAGQVMRVLSVKQEGHQTVVQVRIVTPK
jgi:hypothetical protein